MSQRTWFQHLLDDNNAIELRVSDGIRWASGYYDDLDALLRDIDQFNEYGCNVYTSLNKPTHYVVTNRILDKAKALRDADIEQYTRLLIDLDPERSESPSSDDELERAREAARRVHALMKGYGFTEPAWACSGNGIHLIYRVKIPKASEFYPQWKETLKGLSNLVQVEGVKLDTCVGNPSRICRAYGTINLKRDETAQRPFRRSEVSIPSPYRCVPRSALRAFSEVCIQSITVDSASHSSSPNRVRRDASKPRGTGDYTTLDAVGWFKWMGLYRFTCNPDKHAIVCPWSAEHTGGGKHDSPTCAVLLTNPSYPYPKFDCKHNACQGRDLFDVIDYLEGADQFCSRDWRAKR